MNAEQLTKYFRNNYNKLLPELTLLIKEKSVYGSVRDYSKKNEQSGQIDFIFRKGNVRYITEVDMSSDRWHCFKILAYRSAYIIDDPTARKELVKCLVIISEKIWNPNQRNILAFLNISWVVLNEQGEVFAKEYF